MVRDIILPKLGQTMEEGTIVEWLKEEGDRVDRGEVVLTVESDKATLEVEAPTTGFLRKILVPAGESVPVLTPVGLVTRQPDEDISQYRPVAARPPGEAERLEDTATVEPEAPVVEGGDQERVFASPRARKLAREEAVDLADLKGTGPGGRIVERDVEHYLQVQPPATPVARRLAEREGMDLRTVRATGRGGRIAKEDVERMLARRKAIAAVSRPQQRSETPGEVAIRGVRARIASRMYNSHRATAPVTLTTEVNATAFVEARERLSGSLADELGFRLSYNDLLIKLVGRALLEFPYMNARLERDPLDELTGRTVGYLDRVHVGLAVDTERGLLVPVVRNVDQKRMAEIAHGVRDLIERAQSGDATPDELSGSSFTITNLGMYDIDAFTPIINLPEVAILGVGRIKPEPSVVGEEIVIQRRLWLSLTFDHRLVDGAPAAQFLQRIGQLIEEPYLLLA